MMLGTRSLFRWKPSPRFDRAFDALATVLLILVLFALAIAVPACAPVGPVLTQDIAGQRSTNSTKDKATYVEQQPEGATLPSRAESFDGQGGSRKFTLADGTTIVGQGENRTDVTVKAEQLGLDTTWSSAKDVNVGEVRKVIAPDGTVTYIVKDVGTSASGPLLAQVEAYKATTAQVMLQLEKQAAVNIEQTKALTGTLDRALDLLSRLAFPTPLVPP